MQGVNDQLFFHCHRKAHAATNAGGNNTIKYGNTREQALGIEVLSVFENANAP